MSTNSVSKLALGALASASTASAGIVVFDFPDISGNTNINSASLQVGDLTLSPPSFTNDNGSGVSFNFHAQFYSVAASSDMGQFVTTGTFYFSSEILAFLSVGDSISSSSLFTSIDPLYGSNGMATSQSMPVGTRYIGISMPFGEQTHYGWLELELSNLDGTNGVHRSVSITRLAFNDVAGQSILAGQTTAIPEASTLGLVGGLFGLVALAHARRRKLKQAAASDKFLALAAGEKLN